MNHGWTDKHDPGAVRLTTVRVRHHCCRSLHSAHRCPSVVELRFLGMNRAFSPDVKLETWASPQLNGHAPLATSDGPSLQLHPITEKPIGASSIGCD
jgi:hypothetical protein